MQAAAGTRTEDDGAVVKRSLRIEDVLEQLARDAGIDKHSFPLDHIVKVHVAFDDDEGPDIGIGHILAGGNYLLNGRGLEGAAVKEVFGAHLSQGPAYIFLENDDDDQEERAEHVLEKPVQRVEAHGPGEEVKECQDSQTGDDGKSPGSAQKLNDLIEENTDIEFISINADKIL